MASRLSSKTKTYSTGSKSSSSSSSSYSNVAGVGSAGPVRPGGTDSGTISSSGGGGGGNSSSTYNPAVGALGPVRPGEGDSGDYNNNNNTGGGNYTNVSGVGSLGPVRPGMSDSGDYYSNSSGGNSAFGQMFGPSNIGVLSTNPSLSSRFDPMTGKAYGSTFASKSDTDTHDRYGNALTAGVISNNVGGAQSSLDAKSAWNDGNYGSWLSNSFSALGSSIYGGLAETGSAISNNPLDYTADLSRGMLGKFALASLGPVGWGVGLGIQSVDNIADYFQGSNDFQGVAGQQLSDLGGYFGGNLGMGLNAVGAGVNGENGKVGGILGSMAGQQIGGIAGSALGLMGTAIGNNFNNGSGGIGTGQAATLGTSNGNSNSSSFNGSGTGSGMGNSGNGGVGTNGGGFGSGSLSTVSQTPLGESGVLGEEDLTDEQSFDLSQLAFERGDMGAWLKTGMSSLGKDSLNLDPSELGNISVDLSYLPGYNSNLDI